MFLHRRLLPFWLSDSWCAVDRLVVNDFAVLEVALLQNVLVISEVEAVLDLECSVVLLLKLSQLLVTLSLDLV